MAATTCYDMLLQLKETQSFGRHAVSTPRGLGTSGRRTGGRPSSEEAEDSGTSQAPSTAQAKPRPRAELRPQPRKWPAHLRGLRPKMSPTSAAARALKWPKMSPTSAAQTRPRQKLRPQRRPAWPNRPRTSPPDIDGPTRAPARISIPTSKVVCVLPRTGWPSRGFAP